MDAVRDAAEKVRGLRWTAAGSPPVDAAGSPEVGAAGADVVSPAVARLTVVGGAVEGGDVGVAGVDEAGLAGFGVPEFDLAAPEGGVVAPEAADVGGIDAVGAAAGEVRRWTDGAPGGAVPDADGAVRGARCAVPLAVGVAEAAGGAGLPGAAGRVAPLSSVGSGEACGVVAVRGGAAEVSGRRCTGLVEPDVGASDGVEVAAPALDAVALLGVVPPVREVDCAALAAAVALDPDPPVPGIDVPALGVGSAALREIVVLGNTAVPEVDVAVLGVAVLGVDVLPVAADRLPCGRPSCSEWIRLCRVWMPWCRPLSGSTCRCPAFPWTAEACST